MNRSHPVLAAGSSLLSSARATRKERTRRMLAFEKALLTHSDPDDPELIRDLTPFFPSLNQMYERFETELEISFCKALLSGDEAIEDYLLFNRFEALVSREVNMAGLNRGEKIAMIGSGPFPLTAILLANAFGVSVIAIEHDRDATTLSRQVIKKLGLERKIVVEIGEGQDLVPDASCAIVAVLAQPKEDILDHVFSTYPGCRRVVCRTSHGIRQALYKPTDAAAFNKYNVVCTNVAGGNQTISSMVLGI